LSEGPEAGVPWEEKGKKRPTLKELFKGTTLNGYIEAARTEGGLERLVRAKGYPLENWYVLYAPHLKETPWRWSYQFQGSWDIMDFKSREELNALVSKGEGEIYLHAFRQKAPASWEPITVPAPKKVPEEERQTEIHRYTLVQPIFESIPKVWMWRVSVWNKEKNESEPEIQMTEEDFDRIRP